MQMCVCLEEAHNVTAREESFEVAIRDHRQLVHIIPTHHLERLQCRGIGRDGVDLTDWPHYGLDTGLRPAIPGHLFYFMGRNETDNLIVVDHDITAKASAQQELIDKVLQAQISLYGRATAVHDFPDRSATKLSHQPDLDIARAGGVEQEPAYERHPKAAKVPVFREELK